MLRMPRSTLVIGVSRLKQLKENIGARNNLALTDADLIAI
jgi:aryl-alcohol dehydrogenase-like predicted oxidoreductase